MTTRKRVYTWEFPVRFVHWINFLSIATFAVTGLYIGNPYAHAISSSQWVMGWMRTLHFIAGYAFLMTFIVRLYWFFMGNSYARFTAWLPFTGKRLAELGDTIKFYLFLSKRPPHVVGHTALAGLIYLAVFLLFAFQIVSGFALYSLQQPGVWAASIGAWLFSVMEIQTVRLFHHIVMYLLFAFILIHIYIAWWSDTVERNGIMGSIFGGYKFVSGKD